MNNFIFQNPTKVLFGRKMYLHIAEEIANRGIKKVLIHYGKNSIKKYGLFDEITTLLKNSGISFVEFGGIKANPVLTLVEEGIRICKSEKIEAILAIGGGSVIDSAKAIARGYYYDGNIWDLFEKKTSSLKALPIFTILTISATGSEMNANSVVTNELENKKWPMSGSLESYPIVSVIDPELQKTLPVEQTIYGAVDTLAHVFEFYFDGTVGNDLTDEFCEAIIRTTMKHIKILITDPDNYESRAQLAWCATNALNNILACGRNGGEWSTHGIEHSVSAFYDIAHGAGLSILFPAWMKYTYKNNLSQFERFAIKIFGLDVTNNENSIEIAIDKLKQFLKEIGAPVSLKDVGIREDDLMPMAENAALRGSIGKVKKLEVSDIYQIYRMAYE